MQIISRCGFLQNSVFLYLRDVGSFIKSLAQFGLTKVRFAAK